MMTKNRKLLLRVIISALFITYLMFNVEIPVIFSAIAETKLIYYLLSTCLLGGSILLTAYKYFPLLKGTPAAHPVRTLARFSLESLYYGLFVPSGIGANAVWWHRITGGRRGRAYVLSLIISEYVLYLFILLLAGFSPLVLYSSEGAIGELRTLLGPPFMVFSGVLLLAGACLFSPVARRMVSGTAIRIAPGPALKERIVQYADGISLQGKGKQTLMLMSLYGIAGQAAYVARVFLLARGLEIPVTVIDITWISSLVVLLRTIPVSFAGIGVSEWGYAALFALLSLSPEQGVAVSVLIFSQTLLASFGGWILDWTEKS